jgi:hypothetical protein
MGVLYGIAGYKGHGKDMFSRLVAEAAEQRGVSDTFITHFADDVKELSGRIFGLTVNQMHDPTLKDLPFEATLAMDPFVDAMQEETRLKIVPAGLIARTPREVLQFFGTDYVRKAQDDYWIQRVLAQIVGKRQVLVADTRFANEASALRSKGARIIKIVRIDLPDKKDNHASETEVASLKADLVVGVLTGDLSMPMRVATY